MVFGLLERKYGTVELNPVINGLVNLLGLDLGILLGIGLPTALVVVMGVAFRPLLEIMMLGRLILFFQQARRLRLELDALPERSCAALRRAFRRPASESVLSLAQLLRTNR